MDWIAATISAVADAVERIAGIATDNPLGLLVALLIAAAVWLARRVAAQNSEIRTLTRALFQAEAAHGVELDQATTRILRRRDPRARARSDGG